MKPPVPPVPPGMPMPGPAAPGLRPSGSTGGGTPMPIPGGQFGMPVGAVIAFAGNLLGVGGGTPDPATDLGHYDWLLCDGAALKIDMYPQLFAALGFTYGKPDAGQFLLPDYAGYFLRAVDLGGQIDKDRDTRIAAPGGVKGGIGSTQNFAVQDHTHHLAQKPDPQFPIGAEGVKPAQVPDPTNPGAGKTGQVDPADDTVKVSTSETRPVNMYVYWLIKARPDPWPGYVRMPAAASRDTPPEG